jgi:hypothetical protein
MLRSYSLRRKVVQASSPFIFGNYFQLATGCPDQMEATHRVLSLLLILNLECSDPINHHQWLCYKSSASSLALLGSKVFPLLYIKILSLILVSLVIAIIKQQSRLYCFIPNKQCFCIIGTYNYTDSSNSQWLQLTISCRSTTQTKLYVRCCFLSQ